MTKILISTIPGLVRYVWVNIVYPLLDKYVKTTTNVYDDKALELLNDAILFVSGTLGVNSGTSKLSKK